jgi:excisionase family DNA binding protein
MSRVVKWPDVMTLDEAAKYLRLPRKQVAQLAAEGSIPGRRVADTWRFLKAALEDWLRPKKGSWEALMEQAGAFADDETLPALRAAIYKARGRPEVEDGSEP